MLDLKSKLLAAGLVSAEQVARVEQQKADRKKPRPPQPQPRRETFEEKERARHLEELKKLQKPEQYELIRKWVTRNRLDKSLSIDPDAFEKFFFQAADETVSWLTLEKPIHAKVTDGSAGITAYMSHHGLTHCVLPRDIVEDIAQVFPTWVRVLISKSAKAPE
jgi:hypothetical protein